jgi:hypothetical protein
MYTEPHVSNFDWTDCLAGCEERWGPGGREVDGRRVILWDPSMVLIQTQQEKRVAGGNLYSYNHDYYSIWFNLTAV